MGYVNDLTLPLKMMLKQTNLSIKESHKNILDYMRACNGLQTRETLSNNKLYVNLLYIKEIKKCNKVR